MYTEITARLINELKKAEESMAYQAELQEAQKEIMDAVMAQIMLGKKPKYVVLSWYIALTLRKKYEKAYGEPGVLKFRTVYGYLDIIELNRDDKIILVG